MALWEALKLKILKRGLRGFWDIRGTIVCRLLLGRFLHRCVFCGSLPRFSKSWGIKWDEGLSSIGGYIGMMDKMKATIVDYIGSIGFRAYKVLKG